MNDLEIKRKSMPNEPGVYFFINKKGSIIYVGKALNLRKRVNQYFQKTIYNDPFYEEKIKELVKNIHSIDFIVTENEKEAKILENIQIKKHQPRFNVIMRDSKTYPWVGIFFFRNISKNPRAPKSRKVFSRKFIFRTLYR